MATRGRAPDDGRRYFLRISTHAPPPLRFSALALDTVREPSAALAERAIFSASDHDEGQAFRFEAARGARGGAGEHFLAKDGV